MGVIAEAVLERNGEAIGVIPEKLYEMEVMTWAQIGYHTKPAAFLNVNGYYDEFISFFDKMESKGFLYVPIHEQVIIESEIDPLMKRLLD